MSSTIQGCPHYDSAERLLARQTAMVTSILFMGYLLALRLPRASYRILRSGLLLASVGAHVVHLCVILDLGVLHKEVLQPIVHGVDHPMFNLFPWFAAYTLGGTGYLAFFYLGFKAAVGGDPGLDGDREDIAITIVWSLLFTFYADRLCAALLYKHHDILYSLVMAAGLCCSFAYSRVWRFKVKTL